jgi:hypothetical protein
MVSALSAQADDDASATHMQASCAVLVAASAQRSCAALKQLLANRHIQCVPIFWECQAATQCGA